MAVELITGRELAAEIEAEAARRGVRPYEVVAPLSVLPAAWLNQLRIAKQPKPHTIARVRACISGEPVPPAPFNNFQSKPVRSAPVHVANGNIDPPVPDYPRIDREPCFYCGVRGGIGCRHRRAT